jgi:hypothetical protein
MLIIFLQKPSVLNSILQRFHICVCYITYHSFKYYLELSRYTDKTMIYLSRSTNPNLRNTKQDRDVLYQLLNLRLTVLTDLWKLHNFSSVGIATVYGVDSKGSIPGSARFFSSSQRPDRLWGRPSLISDGYRGIFPRCKAAEA